MMVVTPLMMAMIPSVVMNPLVAMQMAMNG